MDAYRAGRSSFAKTSRRRGTSQAPILAAYPFAPVALKSPASIALYGYRDRLFISSSSISASTGPATSGSSAGLEVHPGVKRSRRTEPSSRPSAAGLRGDRCEADGGPAEAHSAGRRASATPVNHKKLHRIVKLNHWQVRRSHKGLVFRAKVFVAVARRYGLRAPDGLARIWREDSTSTRSWLRCLQRCRRPFPRSTGTPSTTGGSSATCARGPASCATASGAVLRARPRGRRRRPHHVRPVERLLRRPHREEAAEPLPPRLVGALVRHRRLQPRLPFCQNWDISKSQGDRHARRRRVARGDRPRGRGARLPQRRVHLQRPGDLHGVRDRRRRTRATRAASQTVAVTAGYVCAEPRREFFAAHRRRQRRPQGVHRGLLPPHVRRRTSPPCSTRSSTSSTRPTCGSRSRPC